MSPPAAAASLLVLPDELLEDIFLRLDAMADLARASAACTDFRRVVSARRFRRRLRSLRPAPVLGCLALYAPFEFRPAEPQHRSAPAARALAQAADFTFSFLPGGPNGWLACDARDGRVLFYRLSFTAVFADLVVCDPLHRRYVQLPPIPGTGCSGYKDLDPFLDPATDGEKEEEQDLPFRVICAVAQSQHEFVAFHFSSATRIWFRTTFDWSTPLGQTMVEFFRLSDRRYAHGCFYWSFLGMGNLLILDTREMEFSVLDQMPGRNADHQTHDIVEVGEGRLGIVSVADGILELYSKALGKQKQWC
ncbi:hypothetical protein HU200_052723 [Digitaria exilis]|uniref:F-box domain-containing protein n=1 Tax=Digitaria exilis TaxID=1010633 RepID=A0A835E8B5_9POAL|nr:hypothetical protein HU200_052723 [Digitaria exilis]